jgi:hypothetical protein
MTRRQRFFFAPMMLSLVTLVTLVMPAASFASSEVPASCPVTLPPEPGFIPPDPYPKTPPSSPHSFWHGTSGLWTMLGSTGMYTGIASPSPGLPSDIATRNKVFWWSPGFHPMWVPDPQLKIAARRLDGEGPVFKQPRVTNAHVPEWGGWTMLIMLDLPTLGCWEVTGTYGGDVVSFVVWVDPPKPASLKPHYVPGQR